MIITIWNRSWILDVFWKIFFSEITTCWLPCRHKVGWFLKKTEKAPYMKYVYVQEASQMETDTAFIMFEIIIRPRFWCVILAIVLKLFQFYK